MTIFLSEDYMPTINLNRPAIDPGPITEADLAAAREHSTGTVRPVAAGCGQYRWPERRVTMDPHGNQWPETLDMEAERAGWLDSCAAEGGKARAQVPAPRQSWLCTAWLRLVRWLT